MKSLKEIQGENKLGNQVKAEIEALNGQVKNKVLPYLSANRVAYRVRVETPNTVEYRSDRFGFSGTLEIK
jgi:hypothetical protein